MATLAEPALANISAVLFDMDGLLLDSERLAMKALAEAAAALGVPLPPDFTLTLIGLPADLCHITATARFGPDFPVDSYFGLAAAIQEQAIEDGDLLPKPGVTETLDILDRLGLPRAVATSSGRSKAQRHLVNVNLAHRFDAIVTRDDVGRGKPHPDLYLAAAAALGVPPAHCLSLEDSYNGVMAARAAGTQVIMIPDVLPPTPAMRDACILVLDSLHDVHPLLTRARGFA